VDVAVRNQIRSRLSREQDTCLEKVNESWSEVKEDRAPFPYTHSRPLPTKHAQDALKYIKHLTKVYPHQLRYSMAVPLWTRFCQEWCESGDKAEAMRAI